MLNLKSLQLFLTYRVMTISSFFGVLVFYLLANKNISQYYEPLPLIGHSFWLMALLIVTIFSLLSWLSLKLVSNVFEDGSTMQVTEVKPIENIAMPTYIGMFVIALEISGSLDFQRSVAVLAILLILWGLFERVFYFNPIWLFFGYRFYEVKTAEGNSFTLISKQASLKGVHEFSNLRRVNEYTYLEDKVA